MEQILVIFRQSPQRKVKNPMFVFYYILALCLSQFYFGYTLVYLSAVDFNIIAKQFKIDFDESIAQGIFQGIMPIGGAVGAVSSAYFIGLFSRRNIIFFFNIVAVALCLASMVTNYQIYFFVRFLQGVTCGLFSAVIPMIVKEASPHDMASITGSFTNLSIIFGLFFVYMFGYLLKLVSGDPSGGATWQVLFLFPVLTIALQSIILIKVFPYETPKYLAHNNKTQELRELLKQFYKIQYVEELFEHNMKHHGPSVTPEQQDHRSSSAQGDVSSNKGSRSALIYGIFFAFLCPMAGINVMMSYGGEVVSAIAPELRSIMPAILMMFFWFSSFVSLIFIKKYGRKLLTIAGTIGLMFTLFIMSYAYFISQSNVSLSQLLIVTCLFVYLLIYGLTYAPVMWIWVSEALLPHTIGYAIMVNWGGAAIVMIFFPILLEILPGRNPAYIFLFFGIFLTFSLLVTNKFMLETKDKFEHQIMQQYQKLDQEIFGKAQTSQKGLEMKLIDSKQ